MSTIDNNAPSTSKPATTKPRGLASTGRHATVVEDFDYQGADSDEEDEEDEEDNLEYPGDVAESLVCPPPRQSPNDPQVILITVRYRSASR